MYFGANQLNNVAEILCLLQRHIHFTFYFTLENHTIFSHMLFNLCLFVAVVLLNSRQNVAKTSTEEIIYLKRNPFAIRSSIDKLNDGCNCR